MELQSGLVRIASYRKKLPRKKNIHLPTEVWVDVFCYPWIARPKMAQMVDKIGNRWFGEQLQFYLHEWGKHTLRDLYFTRFGINGSNEFPQTAMPEKITTFKSIRIYHFDNRVFNFFRRIQSLLTANTKLDICYNEYGQIDPEYGQIGPKDIAEQLDNARTILDHLLPFIDGIHTLYTDDQMLPIVRSFPPEKFHQIKVLDVSFTRFVQSAVPLIMEWLTTSNNGDEPKLLYLHSIRYALDQQVLETIRTQFMEATQPSTFAVIIRTYFELPVFQFETTNAIGEQLCGMRKGPWEFQIFRHQTNNAEAGDQLRQWLGGNMKKAVEESDKIQNRTQHIRLNGPTIGPGNIFALPDLDVDEAVEKEDEEEKPSTSKKRRICK